MHPYDKEYLRLHEFYAADIKALIERYANGVHESDYVLKALEEEKELFEQKLEKLLDKYNEEDK